jgi:hypothetical protein
MYLLPLRLLRGGWLAVRGEEGDFPNTDGAGVAVFCHSNLRRALQLAVCVLDFIDKNEAVHGIQEALGMSAADGTANCKRMATDR